MALGLRLRNMAVSPFQRLGFALLSGVGEGVVEGFKVALATASRGGRWLACPRPRRSARPRAARAGHAGRVFSRAPSSRVRGVAELKASLLSWGGLTGRRSWDVDLADAGHRGALGDVR